MSQTLTGLQFVNAFALKPERFAWFLGAGASASAGIPTGYSMILDFKKRLFCQLTGLKSQEVDANDSLWVDRINLFFKTHPVLPPSGDPTEYAAAFEAVYPTQEERRLYIENAVKQGSPSFAHKVIGSLLTTGRIPCIFTTNFDHLIETATTVASQLIDTTQRAVLTDAATDNVGRAERCVKESNWPLLAKIHGDFRSVELKNTSDELREQDARMRLILTTVCSRFGLVIIGYSGRDASVMQALTDALNQTNAFPGGIYWVTPTASTILPAVKEFINKALELKISAHIVESSTFDELAGDIANIIDLPEALTQHIQTSRVGSILKNIPLPIREQRKFPVLRCSAIPILVMPRHARLISINTEITSAHARELIRDARIKAVVASRGREVVAFGDDAELLSVFAPMEGCLKGTIELNPEKDSWASGLLYDAFIRALCRKRPLKPRLRRRGHSLIISMSRIDDTPEHTAWRKQQLSGLRQAYSTELIGLVPGCNYPFSEGVQLRMDRMNSGWWCIFEPFTNVELPSSELKNNLGNVTSAPFSEHSSKTANPSLDWQRERWARRYNQIWSRIIAEWANILAGKENGYVQALGLKKESGLDAEFQLSPITAWSRPSHEHDYFLRGGR